MTENELAIVRRAYAKHVLAIESLVNPALETALAAVKREDYSLIPAGSGGIDAGLGFDSCLAR